MAIAWASEATGGSLASALASKSVVRNLMSLGPVGRVGGWVGKHDLAGPGQDEEEHREERANQVTHPPTHPLYL